MIFFCSRIAASLKEHSPGNSFVSTGISCRCGHSAARRSLSQRNQGSNVSISRSIHWAPASRASSSSWIRACSSIFRRCWRSAFDRRLVVQTGFEVDPMISFSSCFVGGEDWRLWSSSWKPSAPANSLSLMVRIQWGASLSEMTPIMKGRDKSVNFILIKNNWLGTAIKYYRVSGFLLMFAGLCTSLADPCMLYLREWDSSNDPEYD